MSTIIMSICWPLRLPAVAKSVLIALADQANDHGVAWPSVATICVRVCCGERAVRNALRLLEASGLLSVRQSPGASSVYTINVRACKRLHEQDAQAQQLADLESAEVGFDAPHVPDTPAPDAGYPGTTCRQPRHQMPPTPAPNAGNPGTTCRTPRHDVPPNRNRTNINTPPFPPGGGQQGFAEHEPVQTSGLGPLMVFKAWVEECKRDEVKPIPDDDPVFEYADRVGLLEEVLRLHWWEFKRRHMGSAKRNRDWRARFRASVEANAYRLWWFPTEGCCQLTTQGVQANRAMGGV